MDRLEKTITQSADLPSMDPTMQPSQSTMQERRPSAVSTSRAPSLGPGSPKAPSEGNPHQFVIGRRRHPTCPSVSSEPWDGPSSPRITPRTPSESRASTGTNRASKGPSSFRRASTGTNTNSLKLSLPVGPKPSWSRQRTESPTSDLSSVPPKSRRSYATAPTAESLPSTCTPKSGRSDTDKSARYSSEASVFSDDGGSRSPTRDKASSAKSHWTMIRETVPRLSVKSKGELDKEFESTFSEMLPDIKQKFVAGIAADSEEAGWVDMRRRQMLENERDQMANKDLHYVNAMEKGGDYWDTRLHLQEARRKSNSKGDAA